MISSSTLPKVKTKGGGGGRILGLAQPSHTYGSRMVPQLRLYQNQLGWKEGL